MGYQQNDAYTAYLTPAQVAALRTAAAARPILTKELTAGPTGLRETLALRDNEVVLLKLRRRP